MEKINYTNFCLEYPSISMTKKQLENIYNRSVERDPYSNEIMWTFLDNFLKKYSIVLNTENQHYPKDNLMMLSEYLLPALQKISMTPKTQLVKNNILQKHYNVQTINNKTMQWLEGRSGKTLKEKIGNVGKIMAPMSGYTIDKKENRIIAQLFRKIEKMIEIKYSELNKINLIESQEFKEIYEKFHRIKKIMKDNGLYYLEKPKDFIPNNTLIDHRDYSKTFRGLKMFNKYIEDYGVSEEEVLKTSVYLIFFGVCAKLMETPNLNHVNFDIELEDIFDKEKKNSRDITLIFIEDNPIQKSIKKLIKVSLMGFNSKENLKINFQINWKLNIKVDIDIKFNIKNNVKDKSGISISCIPLQKDFILNEKGIKGIINSIFKAILEECRISTKKIVFQEEKIKGDVFLNFFSPFVIVNNLKYKKSIYYPKRGVFLDENQYYDINKISLKEPVINISNILSPTEDKVPPNGVFLKFIESMIINIIQCKDDVIIYPMIENIEEEVRNTVSLVINKNFKNAIPVWKSILLVYNPQINEDLKIGEKIFVVDLNNSKISINIIKNNKVALEHHPQIFIENETSKLSFRDFAEDYLSKYISKNRINFNDSEKEYILNSSKFYEIICGETKKNNFIKTEEIIEIKHDKSLIEELQNNYRDKIYSLLEKENIGKNQEKICLIADHLYSANNLRRKVAILKESSLISGYQTILQKVKKEEVLWNEYLPNLSLETAKDKHFYNLDLIKNKSFETKLGKAIYLDVDDELELSLNNKSEYLFPITSENYNEKKEYFLRIRSKKNFPLKSAIKVKLKIEYCYGQAEPYQFKIKPEEGIENDFEVKIIQKEFKVNIKIPNFDIFNRIEKNDIISLLNGLNISFKNQVLGNSNFNHREFKFIMNNLGTSKNIIRNYLRIANNQKNDVLEFQNHPFIKECLVDFLIGDLKREIFLNSHINEEQIRELTKLCKIFISSFGAYVFDFLPEKITSQLDKKRLLNFAFSSGNIESAFSLYSKSEGKYNYYDLYADIAYASWIEKDFIMDFYERYPDILRECLQVVRKDLFNLNKDFIARIKKKETFQRKKYYEETNIFKNSLKFLLAIFRLNLDDDKLSLLGLRKYAIKQLITLIKELDRKIRIENKDKKIPNEELIGIFDQDKSPNLQLEKLEELSNMSDLAYATYLYLIGDNKADLISIKENDNE